MKTTTQWNKLPDLPAFEYLSPDNSKARAGLAERIEALTLARKDFQFTLDNLDACPYDTLPARIDTPVEKTKLLIEELSIRQDVKAWYDALTSDRETAVAKAKEALTQTSNEVKQGLLTLGYKQSFQLDALVKENPKVVAKLNQVRRLERASYDQTNEKHISAVVEELRTLREKMLV